MQVGLTKEMASSPRHLPMPQWKTRSPPGWQRWVYIVEGVTAKSYPFLANEGLESECVGLAKASLNAEAWITF